MSGAPVPVADVIIAIEDGRQRRRQTSESRRFTNDEGRRLTNEASHNTARWRRPSLTTGELGEHGQWHARRLQISDLDDSALDVDEDGESLADITSTGAAVHELAARHFSQMQNLGADVDEVAGILSVRERRASRQSNTSTRSHPLHVPLATSGMSDMAVTSSVSVRRASIITADARVPAAAGPLLHHSTIAIDAASDGESLAMRRVSRTPQLIAEEHTVGGINVALPHRPSLVNFNDPKLAFADRPAPIREVDSVPPTPAVERTIEVFDFTNDDYAEGVSVRDGAAVRSATEQMAVVDEDPRATGTIASARGAVILGTCCFAQLVDNIWMTSINIAIPKVADEFGLAEGTQSWLVSAYTLTFGGFLLLAGVLADRFGRRHVFVAGMLWMSVCSIGAGCATSGIMCIIFRALQGLGAASSVPSAIGVLSNYFVGYERHRAMSAFGAGGAVGFVVGLIMGGVLTGTLGWRYIFYLNAPVLAALAGSGWASFPDERKGRRRNHSRSGARVAAGLRASAKSAVNGLLARISGLFGCRASRVPPVVLHHADASGVDSTTTALGVGPLANDVFNRGASSSDFMSAADNVRTRTRHSDDDDERKPSLDFLGAGLGTSGMVLMTFGLCQSEVSGWGKPLIIVTLIISVLLLLAFAWAERKVANPIMPIYLWKLPSFAGIWCSAFLLYCWWASINYYLALIAQEVLSLSSLTTGLYMIPMGVTGFIVSLAMGRAVERWDIKVLLLAGFAVSVVGTLPAAFVKPGSSFWAYLFPTTLVAVTGVSISYNVASIALVSAVPPAAKSLAGGLINTAFQIGSGFGLAITSVVNESVLDKQADHSAPGAIMKGYQAALFTAAGLVSASLVVSTVAIKSGQQATAGVMIR